MIVIGLLLLVVVALTSSNDLSSNYRHKGIVFILNRRPYEIGDRIHIFEVDTAVDTNGSPTWFVENIDLYTTIVRFGATNEVASYSNGSLYNLQIINAARSPHATVRIFMNFEMNTPPEKLSLFEDAVKEYVESRPKEFKAFTGFRPASFVQELNYKRYLITATHKFGWQDVGKVNASKCDMQLFLFELQKQLGLRYKNAPLPVDINFKPANNEE